MDDDKNKVEVIEGEIEETTPTDGSDATLLLRIEEMIRTHISQIDELGGKITEHKDMIDDVFKNSETY